MLLGQHNYESGCLLELRGDKEDEFVKLWCRPWCVFVWRRVSERLRPQSVDFGIDLTRKAVIIFLNFL